MRKALRFRLNGEAVQVQVAPHETLVELLRDSFVLARKLRPGAVRMLHRPRQPDSCIRLSLPLPPLRMTRRSARSKGAGNGTPFS